MGRIAVLFAGSLLAGATPPERSDYAYNDSADASYGPLVKLSPAAGAP
jgi:hypothetical protein